MKKNIVTRSAFVIALAASLVLTVACDNYRAASPETTVPETAVVVETTEVTETTATPTAVPTVAESTTPAETTAKKIPAEPIDVSIRTDLPAPALYTVTGQTATGKTAVWKDDTRETASRYLVAGDIVTVVAIVGSESRPYALLDTGEYVLLASLEAVPEVTATPTATPKPTKAPTKAPAATTAAPAPTTTEPPAPPPATSPAYYPNAENIRNLIVGSLQAQGRWFPDATSNGGGSMNTPVDYFLNDQEFADDFLEGKFPTESPQGGVTITVTIVKAPNEWSSSCDYVLISCTRCPMPAA